MLKLEMTGGNPAAIANAMAIVSFCALNHPPLESSAALDSLASAAASRYGGLAA
jgi:hypothetical protein